MFIDLSDKIGLVSFLEKIGLNWVFVVYLLMFLVSKILARVYLSKAKKETEGIFEYIYIKGWLIYLGVSVLDISIRG